MSAKSDIEAAQKNLESIDFFNLFNSQNSAEAISEWEETQDSADDTYNAVKKEKAKEKREGKKKQQGKAREKTIDDIEAIKPPKAEDRKDAAAEKSEPAKEEQIKEEPAKAVSSKKKKLKKPDNVGREMNIEEAREISRKEGLKLMIAIPGKGFKDDSSEKEEAPHTSMLRLINTSTGEITDITEDQTLIGKDTSCNISISDDIYISRTHCRIFKSEGIFFIEDLSSTNGTFLNGKRLMPHTPSIIHTDDQLKLADIKYKVRED